MSSQLNQTGLGVRDAFDFWLSQHEISFPQLLEETIHRAFTDWLSDHTEEIIETIAKHTAIAPVPVTAAPPVPETPIEEVPLMTRSYNALVKNGIRTVEQLAKCSQQELLRLKNMGRLSLNEIVSAMSERGITLRRFDYDPIPIAPISPPVETAG